MKANGGGARFTPWALVVFLVALALRALHLWQLRASPLLTARLGDAATYDKWARGIANGDWFGSEVFLQAPLYPYFLGVLYASVGDDPLVVRGVQCVLSALGVRAARERGGEPLLARRGARGRAAARDVRAVDLPGCADPEVRARPVLRLPRALARGAPLAASRDWRTAAALGVALGLLSLARENALLLAGVMVAWLLLLPGLARRAARGARRCLRGRPRRGAVPGRAAQLVDRGRAPSHLVAVRGEPLHREPPRRGRRLRAAPPGSRCGVRATGHGRAGGARGRAPRSRPRRCPPTGRARPSTTCGRSRPTGCT